MPTFVYMTRCDGCGHCVDICPSDIMHIDKPYRRAYNIEPSMCWECYSCVKACPQNAIDVRGYADFAPLGHSVRVDRVLARVFGHPRTPVADRPACSSIILADRARWARMGR